MEGTSCADDMRLLHEKNRESFLISFSSDLVFGGGSDIIQSHTINVRSILGAIDELYTPVGHQQAVFIQGQIV